jgi:hypothetical protein
MADEVLYMLSGGKIGQSGPAQEVSYDDRKRQF